MAISKEQILTEIKRTAKENGGKPLGMGKFKQETGISLYDCQSYWSTFGEAQREAGFAPNTLQVPHNEEFIFESLIVLMREVGRFPTKGDLVVKRKKDSKFPSPSSIHRRYGEKRQIAEKVSEYATQKGYNDIIELCRIVVENSNEKDDLDDSNSNQSLGSVYLFKSGKYYKIGKTKDTVRRGNELKIQLPEDLDLIHEIKTDDPSGIEAYWHRRFEGKRMNGEWFDLSSSEIKAFKLWRRIV